MKYLLVIVIITVLSPIRADDTASPHLSSSKFDKSLTETQTVVLNAYSIIGSVTRKDSNKFEVDACEVSGKGMNHYAIQICGQMVDSDEIVPLLAAIDSLLKMDKTITKLDYFYANYTTRSGLCFTRNSSPDFTNEVAIVISNHSDGSVGASYGVFTADEMVQLKALIQKAQAVLQSIQK